MEVGHMIHDTISRQDWMVCYVPTENQHGTLGVCADEMKILRLTPNEQKSLICCTESGCSSLKLLRQYEKS
jgi:hypothetical protein